MKMKHALWMAALALLGAGCRKDDAGTLRFRYWGDTQEIAIISGMLRDFELAHPGVKVRDERKPAGASQYSEILLAEFAAGNAPDVIFTTAEIFDVCEENHLLEDLTPMLSRDKELRIGDFYEPIIRRFSKDGRLYVLPRDIAPFACVYYNKNLFKAAGLPFPKDSWTFDEMRADAKKITRFKEDGKTAVWGFVDDWPLIDPWVLGYGGSVVDNYDRPTRVTLDSPGSLQGILARWDMMYTDKTMPSGADSQAISGGTMAMFLNGELGMFYSGIWKTPEFRKIKTFDWDIAMIPKGPGGKRGFSSGGSGYAIRKGAKNKDLAWQLVRFLADGAAQKRMASTGLVQPSLKKLADSPAFLDGQKPLNKKLLLEAARIATHPPRSTKWLQIEGDVLGPIMGQIWLPGFKREEVAPKVRQAVALANQKYFGAKP